MWRRAALLLVLAACKRAAHKAEDAAPAAAAKKPLDAAPATPVDAEPTAPSAGEPIAIAARADGVGPLDGKDVPLDKLKELFVGYEVVLVPADPEDEIGEDHVEVSHGEDLILEISIGGRRVTIDSAEVATHMGVKVGDTYAAVVAAVGKLQCEDGGQYASTTEAYVFCTSKKHAGYSFDFIDFDEEGSPRTQGSDLLQDKKKLAGATLDRLVWTAN